MSTSRVKSSGVNGITQLTGDVTAGPGSGSQVATIPAHTVTNAKLANMAAHTIKSNATGGSADPADNTLNAVLADALGNGTAGQVIKGDGAGNFSLGTVGSGSGGGMVAVGTATVTGSAATTLTLSGLDLNTDKHYYFEWALLNANSGAGDTISWYYNSDTTPTNYDRQQLAGNSTSVSASRSNDNQFIALTSTGGGGVLGSATGVAWLKNDLYGKPSGVMLETRDATTTMVVSAYWHQWRTANTNVTQIVLSGNTANGLAIGSYIKCWKYVPV